MTDQYTAHVGTKGAAGKHSKLIQVVLRHNAWYAAHNRPRCPLRFALVRWCITKLYARLLRYQ